VGAWVDLAAKAAVALWLLFLVGASLWAGLALFKRVVRMVTHLLLAKRRKQGVLQHQLLRWERLQRHHLDPPE
jgi:hypothetical protein